MTEEGMQGGDERGRIGGRCRRWGREEERKRRREKGGLKGRGMARMGVRMVALVSPHYSPTHKHLSNGLSIFKAVVHS